MCEVVGTAWASVRCHKCTVKKERLILSVYGSCVFRDVCESISIKPDDENVSGGIPLSGLLGAWYWYKE